MPLPDEPVHKYLEFTRTIFTEGTRTFLLIFASGGEVNVYVAAPEHLKQISKSLNEILEKYEKEYGPLEGRRPNDPMKTSMDIFRPDQDHGNGQV